VPRKGGVPMLVFLSGIRGGEYRVAIHTTGNYSSPNGFSAGPVWSIPGVGPEVLSISTNSDGTANVSRRVNGVHLDGPDGLMGRVVKAASDLGTTPVLRCDVARDEDIDALFASIGSEWGALDSVLHSIAFPPREALQGDILNGLSRAAFATAHDISSYSFA